MNTIANQILALGGGVGFNAPQLSLTISDELQTTFRGIAVGLVALLFIIVLVKKINFGRGGMGGGQMGAKVIIPTLLVAAMLMDVDLFVTALNWILSILYEAIQWMKDALDGSGGGSGTVDIN